MTLMELKLLTTRYGNNIRNKQDRKLKDENTKLNKANNNDNHEQAKVIRDKIKTLEEEILINEWKKHKMFSNLEDECPTKGFLNLENQIRDTKELIDSQLATQNMTLTNQLMKTTQPITL